MIVNSKVLCGWLVVLALLAAAPQSVVAQQSPLEQLLQGQGKAKPVRSWEGFDEWTTSVAFSADGKTLAVGTYEQIALLDTSSDDVRQTIGLKVGFVQAVAYARTGSLLAAGGYQTSALLETADAPPRLLKGQRGYVTGVAVSPDGKRLATSAEDETARVWNIADGETIVTFTEHRLPVMGIAFSPDGTLVASADGDAEQPRKKGTAYVWDAATGEARAKLAGHERGINCVAFSPDGKYVVTGSTDETVRVWETDGGKLLKTLEGHSRPVNAAAFTPDGKLLATAGGGRFQGKNNVVLWNTDTWEESATIEAHTARVTGLAISPDGAQMATTGYDKMVHLWSVPVAKPAEKKEP